MGKNPRNIISEKFIVGTDAATLGVLLLEEPDPPEHEYDDIQESVDMGGMKVIPTSLDFMRDYISLERPPWGLNGGPPGKDRVYKHWECPLALCVIWEVGRAGSGRPLTDLDGSIPSRK